LNLSAKSGLRALKNVSEIVPRCLLVGYVELLLHAGEQSPQ